MKKLFLLFSFFLTIIVLATVSSASAGITTVSINDAMVHFPDQQPIAMNDRIYIPVRFVSEDLLAEVEWDEKTNTVIITSKN